MKKLLLCGTALFLSLSSMAQGYQTIGAYDDFAQEDFYKNGSNGEGVVWFADGVFTMTRAGDGKVTFAGTNVGGAGQYPLFGANFNDSNDDGTGTPFTLDLSGGANVRVDIKNTSSQMLFVDVKLVDIDNDQSEFEPNISDIQTTSTYGEGPPYKRKALNGFTLTAGERRVITIDLSSVPGSVGGLSAINFDGCATGPYYCPTTQYIINPAAIKAVLFRVNFGSSDINLSEGDGDHTADTFIPGASIQQYTGTIEIYDFRVGTVTTSNTDAVVEKSLSLYPNPANDEVNVVFNAENASTVTLTDIVGNVVYSTPAYIGSNKVNINTSEFSTGMYLLNIATENGTVVKKVMIQ